MFKEMKIIIAGDLVITDDYGRKDFIDQSVEKLFSEADYSIVNLEAPVTENTSKNKILKTGPHLQAKGNSILPTLKRLNIDMVTLANNHILDYGEKGLYDTLDFCQKNNIDTIGVGKNIDLANTAKRIDLDNHKISIVNFAENEWASATEKTAGANPMDLIDNVKLIQQEKEVSDFVFVVVHGGHEYYNLPSPRMQKQYRFYIDNGADIVVGHHTHCISGYEIYNEAPIYYSLGNFLFTMPSHYDDWYHGIVLEVLIDKNNKLKTKPIFVAQNRSNFMLSIAEVKQVQELQKKFQDYSSIIQNKKLLYESWKRFVDNKSIYYLKAWSPFTFINNKYIKSILNRIGFKFKNKKAQAKYLNLMRCEAHSDLSKEVIENEIK